jgi:peptidoglycan/xylan/chitin deacetylase (PgdA/CDA1 family)
MTNPGFGALVISLDFELHWGVRDVHTTRSPYTRNLYGARNAIPRILDLFGEFDIAATWATVGFLFASSRQQLDEFAPAAKPAYDNRVFFPYDESIGTDEQHDPLHFAPSLIKEIRRRPRQEVGSHTFSHYYCREPGQTRETFEADLRSAVAIAAASGMELRSLVLPRNQINREYADVLRDLGIWSYRGTQPGSGALSGFAWDFPDRRWRRAIRLVDAYVNVVGNEVLMWEEVEEEGGLCNVAATIFLRPYDPRLRALEPLRLRRIVSALTAASRSRAIAHIWWHPHNFGAYTDENLAFLRQILEAASRLRASDGLRSLTMLDVARIVRNGSSKA